jgi:hypothetical protein
MFIVVKNGNRYDFMKIKKLKFDGMDSFNDYGVEMSYGQLVAIRNALEKDHSDPLSDELYAELNYYLQNVPGPGESSDEFKAERDAAKKTKEEAGEPVSGETAPQTDTELEAGLPAPPSDEEEDLGAPLGSTEGDELGPEGEPGEPGEGAIDAGPKLSPEEREVIDRGMPTGRPTGGGRLPAPPAE